METHLTLKYPCKGYKVTKQCEKRLSGSFYQVKKGGVSNKLVEQRVHRPQKLCR